MKIPKKDTFEALGIFLKSFSRIIVKQLEKSNPGYWEIDFEKALIKDDKKYKDWKNSFNRRGNRPTIELIDFKYLETFANNRIELFHPFFGREKNYLPIWLGEITKVRNLLDHYNSDLTDSDIAKAWLHMEEIAKRTGDTDLAIALNGIKESVLKRKNRRRSFVSVAVLIICVGGFIYYYSLISPKKSPIVPENHIPNPTLKNASKFVITKKEDSSFNKPAVLQLDTSKNSHLNSLVRINRINWIGGGAYASVANKQYSFSSIIDTTQLQRMSSLSGTACALEFELETRSDIDDRVTIDSLEILVLNYKPLPQYELTVPAPFAEKNVLYVEIDNPQMSKTNNYSVLQKITTQGKIDDFGIIYLEKNKPETFVIRINAKTPGIYKIKCQVIVRNKKNSQTISLNKPMEWLFDKYP
jgi:hypothetical protein